MTLNKDPIPKEERFATTECEVLFEFGEEIDPEPSLAPCRAKRVGDGLYELLEQPLSKRAKYGDVVRAELSADASLCFTGVEKKARTIALEFSVPQHMFESEEFQAYCASLAEKKIHWELIAGSIFLCFPPWREAKEVRRAVLDVGAAYESASRPQGFWDKVRRWICS